MTDYEKKSCDVLIKLCKERKIKGYSNKNKQHLITLLQNKDTIQNDTIHNDAIQNDTIHNDTMHNDAIQNDTNNVVDNTLNFSNCQITVADLFCGAGGFSEGFYQEGFNVVFALDYWKPAYITHKHNHKDCKTVCMDILDIKTIEELDKIIPDTDIIIGSPPCVSFSNSNVSGKADKTYGIQLIQQFLKIVLYKKTKSNSILKYWIMENVPNSIEYIKNKYTAIELGLDPLLPDLHINNKNILIASDYGSPQRRKRAIVGDYIVPTITHNCTNHIYTVKILESLGKPLNNDKQVITDPSFQLSLTQNELTDHFYDSELPKEWVVKAKRLKTDHGFMGKMDFPDRTDRLCRTIMTTESYCSRESIIFKKENCEDKYRTPTIRELACLMGFPIDYQFIGTNSNSKHKQIGNAVCVHMSMALAHSIKQKINIQLNKKPRILIQTSINLNDLKHPIYSNYKSLPKKMNSKFHIHVPAMKINQLRVELDNITSDFEQSTYNWRCLLHKGSGKNALKTVVDNNILYPILSRHKSFDTITKFIDKLKKCVYDNYQFQEKNCNIVHSTNNHHYSPFELLQLISTKIKKLDIKSEIEVNQLDLLLKYTKKNTYPIEILYSLYILNMIINNLNHT